MLRYAARVNGLNGLLITKLDVLDSLPAVRLCNAYRSSSDEVREFPTSQQLLQSYEPIYEEMEGWCQDTTGIRRYEDLPVAARRFIERIGEVTGLPVMAVSVGPDREQTIMLQEIPSMARRE
jgi:adenylosuccinate synthase